MERIERLHRLETLFGGLGGLYGIAVTVVTALIVRSTGAAPCEPPAASCIAGINSGVIAFLVLFGALSLGVLFGALAHGRSRRAGALGVLLLCTVVLAMLTLLAIFSVGLFLAPGMLAAVVASLYALVALFESRPPARRFVELAAGAASGIVGIATLDYIFFFPNIQVESSTFGGYFSVASLYGMGKVLPALLTFGFVAFLAAGGASSNALSGSRGGRALLVIATLALGAAVIAAQFVDDTAFYLHSVGSGLLPSLVLALVALALAFDGRGGRAPVAA